MTDRESANPHTSSRTDSKSSLLPALDGVLIAALGKAPGYALAPAGVGTVATVAASVLAVLVAKPRLDPTRSNGFARWGVCSDPDELLRSLADDVRPRWLHGLSVLCERKMRRLVWAARLSVVAVAAVAIVSAV